jgi:regulator of sigma E protease
MWDFLTDTIFSAPKDTSFTLRWERDGDVSRTEAFDAATAAGGLGVSHADPKAGSGLVIGYVSAGSLGERLALKANDTLTHLNDEPIETWDGLLEALKAQEGQTVLTYSRRLREAEFKLAMVKVPAKLQPDRERPIFGASAFSQQGQPELIPNEGILGYALHHCVTKSLRAVEMNFKAIVGLVTGKVPLKELGGPIVIGQLAAETGDRGWSYFFRLMVWLSVSLGLINLLPIPILDGGHILFLAMEGIRRKPVSLRTRQVATYLGFALIIFLMVTAFKNDIEKSFF